MTLTQIIVFLALFVAVLQWKQPLYYLRIANKIDDVQLNKRNFLSNFYIYSFVILFVLSVTIPNWMTYLSFGVAIIVGLSIGTSLKLNKIAIEVATIDNQKHYKSLVYTFFGFVFALIIIMIQYFTNLIFGRQIFDIEVFIRYSESYSVVITLMFRIALYVYITIAAYLILIYSLSYNSSKKARNHDVIKSKVFIEKSLVLKRILLCITVGVFFSLFQFAETDLTYISVDFQKTFESTQTVLQLITSSIFIPLLIDELLKRREVKKYTDPKKSRMRVPNWKRRT